MIAQTPQKSQDNRIIDVQPCQLHRFPAFSHCPYDGAELKATGQVQKFGNLRAHLGNCPRCGTTRTVKVELE